MRRTIVAFMVVAGMALVMAGCGGPSDESTAPKTGKPAGAPSSTVPPSGPPAGAKTPAPAEK